MKKHILIGAITDLSRSFVDPDGSFYCGSTPGHKEKAKEIVEEVLKQDGLVIFNTDLHPYTSSEFIRNKGLYPTHNLPKKFWNKAYEENKELERKSISPELTDVVNDALLNLKTGLFVPRHVYFQEIEDKTKLSYLPEDIEETFGVKIIDREDFLGGNYRYMIAPKKFFDATRLSTDKELGKGINYLKIPSVDENIFSLIKQKYPENKYDMTIINPSVVEGICSLFTAIGQKQTFPNARILTPLDGVTPLIGYAFETAIQSRDACKRISQDIGIEYLTTQQILEVIKNEL